MSYFYCGHPSSSTDFLRSFHHGKGDEPMRTSATRNGVDVDVENQSMCSIDFPRVSPWLAQLEKSQLTKDVDFTASRPSGRPHMTSPWMVSGI